MSIYSSYIEVEAEESLKKASIILAGIPGGAKRAIGSTLSRVAQSGKTAVKGYITEEYTLSSGTFLSETKNINHYKRGSDGNISVVFGFRGNVIPLIKFQNSVSKSGGIFVQVKRSNSGDILKHAFNASVGSHTGIFERVGEERFPIKELFGPATPQMIYANESVLDKMENKMAETFDSRIDHEIMRVLNGWGGK